MWKGLNWGPAAEGSDIGWRGASPLTGKIVLPKTSDGHATCPSPNPQGSHLGGECTGPSPALDGSARGSGPVEVRTP